QEASAAPDMATTEQTMAWMMDTYSMQVGHAVPEIVTGKPISLGGSLFRQEATGAGVVMVIIRACERLGWSLGEQRCVVQGFGNVGGVAAAELHERGARVVAVSDVSGGVHDEHGLDVPALRRFAAELGRLFWDRAEIRAKLADQLNDAFDRVWKLADEQGLSLRSAALVAGIREVSGALTARGIYP